MSKIQLIYDLTAKESLTLYQQYGSLTKILQQLGIKNDPRCRKLLSEKITSLTGNNNHSFKHSRKVILNVKQIRKYAHSNSSMTQLLKLLNLQPVGNNFSRVRAFLNLHNIILQPRQPKKWTNNLVYCKHSKLPRAHLSKRVFKDNWMSYQCAWCQIETEWNRKPIKLQLDHKNGVSNDNRKSNLRWMCPNCHSQTPTFGGKLHKKVKIEYAARYYALEEIIAHPETCLADTLGIEPSSFRINSSAHSP